MPFQKGHPQYGHMPKNKKTYKTIAKEKAREIFEQKQLAKWELISEKQAKAALFDQKAREYTINQVIGKAKETVEVQGIEFIYNEDDKANMAKLVGKVGKSSTKTD